MQTAPQFVADVHLGRLARLLRMLGFDTAYHPAWGKPQLLKTAITEHRILLSRNSALGKNPFVQAFIISSEKAQEQLQQVILHFHLQNFLRPFSRCMVCNQNLQPVAKGSILHLLQPETIRQHQQFWQCPQCNRVYWQGSHYHKMMRHIEEIKHREA